MLFDMDIADLFLDEYQRARGNFGGERAILGSPRRNQGNAKPRGVAAGLRGPRSGEYH